MPEVVNKPLRVTRSFFDFESFEGVVLGKDVSFQPVSSIDEALAHVGNDGVKLLEIVNEGLKAQVRSAAYSSIEGWHQFKDESKGAMSELNGAYEGTPTDEKKVRETVNVLARTIFGYSPDLSKEEKKARKDKALQMIRDTPSIREGLASAASTNEDE